MKKIVSALIVLVLSIGVFSQASAQTVTQSVQNAGQAIVDIPGQLVGGVAGAIPGVINDTVNGAVNAGVNFINGKVNRLFNDIGGNGQLPSGDFRIENPDDFGSDIAQNSSAREYILRVLNFFLSFLGLLAVIIVIYAGIIYLTQGEDGKDKAKNMILYAVVGILVVLVSFALVNTVIREAPVGGDDRAATGYFQTIESYAVQDRGSPSDVIDAVLDQQKGPEGLFSDLLASTFGDGTQQLLVDRDNIASLIVIKASDFIDSDEAIFVSLEEAQKGLTFGFATASEVDWDMGDGFTQSTAPGKTFTYSYGTPGIYPVTAIGTDNFGQRVLQVKAVVVGAKFAQFNVSQKEAPVGRSIRFDGTASGVEGVAGNVIRYSWSCSGGIGCFGNVEAPLFDAEFSAPGTYTIGLEIETSTGLVDGTAQQLVITASEPMAYFDSSPVLESDSIGNMRLDASESRNSAGSSEGLLYQWNINGDLFETRDPLVEYRFVEVGTYPVELVTVEDLPGQSISSSVFRKDVVVGSVLAVDFRIDPENIFVGEEVVFTPQRTKAVRFSWDFGDGNTTRVKEPIHTYDRPGERVVSLTVESGDDSQTSTKTVSVLNRNQVTNFIQAYVSGNPADGETIVITTSDILELEPAAFDRFGQEADFTHTWYLNDVRMDLDSLLAQINDFGVYEVKLLSRQNRSIDQQSETVMTIEVQNRNPIIVSSSIVDDPSLPSGTVRVVTNAFDPEGRGLQYFVKAFFRGEEEVVQSGFSGETLVTLKNGNYIIEVEVLDGDGGSASYRIPGEISIEGVLNSIPEVNFIIDPVKYHFTTTDFVFRAKAQDADEDTLYYTWFIDGSPVQEGKKNVVRGISFDRPGTYNVALRVDDKRGGVAEISYDIDVEWDPNIKTAETNTAPNVDICTVSGTIVHPGQPVVFRSQSLDINDDDLSYVWALGTNTKYSTQPNIKHVFEETGETEVSVSVYDGFISTDDRIMVQVVPSNVLLPTRGDRVCLEEESTWQKGLSDQVQRAIGIFPTQIQNTLLRRFGLSFLVSQTRSELASKISVEVLHEKGFIGLGTNVDIEELLSDRKETLNTLLQKTSPGTLQGKIQSELEALENNPSLLAQEYVKNLPLTTDEVVPTFVTSVGGRLILQAQVPNNFPKPLLIVWDDGNGNRTYGESTVFSFEEEGFYLASLKIADELTESEDWIIIQVENK